MKMYFTYEYFVNKLNERIKSDENFYYELLVNVINNPKRYTGVFRLTNAKTKLIQNVTQSHEIKFGDFMEDIVTEYIEKMGYTNISKDIGCDEDGNALSADQVFYKNDTIYLIEQKIRDDHDSTKKRGQYQNFKKKYDLLKRKYPQFRKEVAIMWFIDDGLVKNRNYYRSEAAADTPAGIDIKILYGSSLFEEVFNKMDAWNELVSYLTQNKRERSDEVLTIPDFDTSPEMLRALKKLKEQNYNLFKRLKNDGKYEQLRNELFPSGYNLNKV